MRIRALPSALLASALLAALAAPTAQADASTPCSGPNEFVIDDARDTLADPTHPECGSLTDPCFLDGSRCWGCGPDAVEWVIGPIYCQ